MNKTIEAQLGGHPPVYSLLPLTDVIDYFNLRCKKNPNIVGEYKSILMQIDRLKERFGDQIRMSISESDRTQTLHLKQLTCEFIVVNKGRIFCPDCHSIINAEDIIYERYSRGKRENSQTMGKRLYCSKNHLIMEMLDMKI